jgi:hypothetical protein
VLVIAAVAAVALLPHVFAGGFHADDWVNGGQERFHPGSGFFDAVTHSQLHARDAWSVVNNAEWAVFGVHPAPFLLLVALAAVLEASLFLAVARRFGAPYAPALAAAVVLLLLPAADATRLWPSGLMIALFSCSFLLGGLLLALRGLEVGGRRGAAFHAGALVLYALSVNGYELGAGLIVLLGFVYLARAQSRRAALWRWAADVAVVLAVLARYSATRSDIGLLSFHQKLDHARAIAEGGLHRATETLFPVPGLSTAAVLVPALLIVAAAGAVAVRTVAARRDFLLGGGLIAGGAVVAAAGWAILVSSLAYNPSNPGQGNRINGVSAFGLVMGLAGMTVLVALLLRTGLGRRAPAMTSIVTGLLVIVAVGDFVWLRNDAADWDRAADRSRGLLSRLQDAVPSPPPGARLYTFGEAGFSAPLVYIFAGAGNQDLYWAARLRYDTDSIGAYPVLTGMHFTCGEATMTLEAPPSHEPVPYGRALLVDLPSRSVATPRNRRDCVRETAARQPYAPLMRSSSAAPAAAPVAARSAPSRR